jgi:hypothetical protein
MVGSDDAAELESAARRYKRVHERYGAALAEFKRAEAEVAEAKRSLMDAMRAKGVRRSGDVELRRIEMPLPLSADHVAAGALAFTRGDAGAAAECARAIWSARQTRSIYRVVIVKARKGAAAKAAAADAIGDAVARAAGRVG